MKILFECSWSSGVDSGYSEQRISAFLSQNEPLYSIVGNGDGTHWTLRYSP